MLKWLLKALLQRVLILIALVVVSFILPVASFWLVRDSIGAQVVFWASPWVVAFWSVVAYVLVGSRFWRGKGSVEEWKLRHGSFLWRHAKTTAWMFASLAFSYAAELAFVFWCRRPLALRHIPALDIPAIGVHDPVERDPWVS